MDLDSIGELRVLGDSGEHLDGERGGDSGKMGTVYFGREIREFSAALLLKNK